VLLNTGTLSLYILLILHCCCLLLLLHNNRYKVEWDSAEDFSSDPDGGALGSHQTVVSSATACVNTPCEYTVPTLVKGKPYYVRVFAYNAYGYSATAALTEPASQAPCTQPAPPAELRLTASDATTLTATFGASPDNGGKAVTSYKLEWDAVGLEGLAAGGSVANALYNDVDVQTITASATTNTLAGGFYIAYQGYATPLIVASATSDEVAAALTALPTVGELTVARSALSGGSVYGYKWTVTRPSSACAAGSIIGRCDAFKVSTTSTAFPSAYTASATGSTLTGASAAVAVAQQLTALAGFDQQLVELAASVGSLAGTFRLTYKGLATVQLPWNASAAAVASALQALGSGILGSDVRVARTVTSTAADTGADAVQWSVAFAGRAGSVELLSLDTTFIVTPTAAATLAQGQVTELVNGALPALGATTLSGSLLVSKPGAVDLTGLVTGANYHVRVSAYNGVNLAYGATRASTPAAVAPSGLTAAPAAVEVAAASGTALRVSWSPPVDSGGAPVLKYRVDWDGAAGTPEVQLVTLTGAASGTFKLRLGGATTTALPWNADAARYELITLAVYYSPILSLLHYCYLLLVLPH
jgi:Fibronectin type III domain